MTTYKETPKGICVLNVIMNEYTLCGDAFDLASEEPGYEQRATHKRTVTCPDCARIIRDLRGVRTEPRQRDEQA